MVVDTVGEVVVEVDLVDVGDGEDEVDVVQALVVVEVPEEGLEAELEVVVD